jgi:hypothetical protein
MKNNITSFLIVKTNKSQVDKKLEEACQYAQNLEKFIDTICRVFLEWFQSETFLKIFWEKLLEA